VEGKPYGCSWEEGNLQKGKNGWNMDNRRLKDLSRAEDARAGGSLKKKCAYIVYLIFKRQLRSGCFSLRGGFAAIDYDGPKID